MPELLRRAFGADFEIRADDDGGRTVCGIACPFGEPAEILDWDGHYWETFERGAFARTISERGGKVKFLALHDRFGRLPLGRATLLREDTAGLYSEFRVSKTAQGDEVLELIRDGALDAFSIGFTPIAQRDTTDNGRRTVTRTEVKLSEVSAVPFPSYEGAAITGVRGLSPSHVDEALHALYEVRQGKTLSATTVGTLRGVLDHIATSHQHAAAGAGALGALLDEHDQQDEQDDMTGRVGDDEPRGLLTVQQARLVLLGLVTRGAIGSHSTATTDGTWDKGAQEKRLGTDTTAAQLRRMYAWVDGGEDAAKKGSYKFPHHEVGADGQPGAANTTACSASIAALNGGRGGASIPDSDRSGVYSHLAAHLRAAGKDVPDLK